MPSDFLFLFADATGEPADGLRQFSPNVTDSPGVNVGSSVVRPGCHLWETHAAAVRLVKSDLARMCYGAVEQTWVSVSL